MNGWDVVFWIVFSVTVVAAFSMGTELLSINAQNQNGTNWLKSTIKKNEMLVTFGVIFIIASLASFLIAIIRQQKCKL